MNKSSGTYVPPQTIWDAYGKLNFNEPLESDDPRFVDTEQGRGDFNFSALLRYLKVDPRTYTLKGAEPPQGVYIAFCGHRGCGKSTELKRLAQKLDKKGLFLVVFLDSSRELDINNLKNADVFMALAKKLFERVEQAHVTIDPVYLQKLEIWFRQRVITEGEEKEYTMDIKTGAEAQTGIPFFGQTLCKCHRLI